MPRLHLSLAIAVLCALVACGGGGGKGRRVLPGTGCVRNSDCQDPLSCSFGRCHEACRVARDCPAGQMCVVGENDRNVCLLPEEESCALNSECPEPLICAQDLKCRNECVSARDCATDTQVCVATEPDGRVCAEPEDLIDGELRSLLDGGTQTGAPGGRDAGDAGDRGDGGTAGGGSDPGDAGTSDAGSDAGATQGAGSDGGESTDHDASADEGAAGDPGDDDPIPSVEVEPNDTRDDANPYQVGDAVDGSIAGPADIDYYRVEVPADATAGGYFTGAVTDVDGGAVSVVVSDASTNAQVVMATDIAAGASVFYYWSAAAGETYHVRVQRQPVGNETFSYTFAVDFTAIEDPFEPNQTRDEPKPIALGETASAYLFAGYADQNVAQTDYHDWYVIEEPLAAGTLEVVIADVPANVTARVRLYDASNAQRDSAQGSLGSNVAASFDVPAPGTYRLLVEPSVAPSAHGQGLTLPDHFTRSYELTVTQ